MRKGGEVACVAGIFKWQSQAVSHHSTLRVLQIYRRRQEGNYPLLSNQTLTYSSSLNCHILPGQWYYCSSFPERELTFRKLEFDQDCTVIKLCPPSPNLKIIRRNP